ncbi:MAG TPA: thiamine phosphate synthase [Candidatus Marinimicrobia bacterium]|nr:thiamine phosphate synthase [Candidatus Neomarinimicrobiota bacterium]
MKDLGLYLIITNPALPYHEIAEIAVQNNVKMLQLREKSLNDRDLLKVAHVLREKTADTNTLFAVNDRADIAKLVKADILHLGQNDLSIADARKIVGNDMMIGLSTHSFEQAKNALDLNPAYIGFGPIFKTPTKAVPDPIVGTAKIRSVVDMADKRNIPVVAIGGIFPDNLTDVLHAGARNISMVRYFMESADLNGRIKQITKIINSTRHTDF